MLNPVRLGTSSHTFQHKPPASDSMSEGDYDSADDLEGTVAEDVVISNKIPESRINFTVNKVPLSTQPQGNPSNCIARINTFLQTPHSQKKSIITSTKQETKLTMNKVKSPLANPSLNLSP